MIVRSRRGARGEPLLVVEGEVVVVDDEHGPASGVVLGVPLELPFTVRDLIAEQYRDAVAHAPSHFSDLRNDEDAVTGSFGGALRDTVTGSNAGWVWRTSVKKVKGRGKGAGEKRYGADLAIEIEIKDKNGVCRRKTLLVQSKKNWNAKDAKLGGQARQITQFPGSGIVVDYRPETYRAVSADAAANADGDARAVPEDDFRDLAEVLGGDFLECTIGSTNVFYDVDQDIMIVASIDSEGRRTVRAVDFVAKQRVHTSVGRVVTKRQPPREKAESAPPSDDLVTPRSGARTPRKRR